MRSRCGRPRRRRGPGCWRAPPNGSACRRRRCELRDGVARVADETRLRVASARWWRGSARILQLDAGTPLKPPADYRVVGHAPAARRHPGQARGRSRLRARHARARHAARPRGAPALCRRRPWRLHRQHAGVGRRSVDRAHPRHPRGGGDPRLRRHRRRARGAGRAGACASCGALEALAGPARHRTTWRRRCARNPSTQRLLVDEGDVDAALRAGRRAADAAHATSGPTRCTRRSGRPARWPTGTCRTTATAATASGCASGPARRTRMCCAPTCRA